MQFAPNFKRNKKGHIEFPGDAPVRKQAFPEDAMKHPAKNNLYLLQAITEYLFKSGELVLDPMAGTGSMMIAALSGIRVICIDCSPIYAELLQRSRLAILEQKPDADIITLEGDCLEYLPMPVDHVCFSPPFSDYLMKKAPDEFQVQALGTTAEHLSGFSAGKGNVGAVPEFFHIQQMEKIFVKLAQSIPLATGTMTIITRDRMENRRRIYLTKKYIRAAEHAGFKMVETFKRTTPDTGLDRYNQSLGLTTVDDEDILVFRRAR